MVGVSPSYSFYHMPPKAFSERHQIVKNSIRFLTATVLGQFIGLIRSVFIPVLLSPAQLGVFNLMNVVTGYGGNSHLGILHGMNKLIPMLRGEGALAEVERVKDSAFWTNVLLNTFCITLIWIGSYVFPSIYSTALRITAVIIFLMSMFGYYYSLLRADNRFKLVSAGVGAISILATIFVLGLSWLSEDRLIGALWGSAVSYGLLVLFWAYASRYRFSLNISCSAVYRSFVMGAPLIIIGVFDSLFLSIDRWVIASYMEATMLGYYALGIMASNIIGLVPGSFSGVLYPKMLERFGATKNPYALKGLFAAPARLMAGFMCFVIGAVVIILPVLIKYTVPKYLPSLPLLGILIPGAFFYASAGIPGCFVLAIDRQRLIIAIQLAAMLVALAIDFVVVKMGLGIIWIAWSTAFAYAVYGCGYMAVAAYFAFEKRIEMIYFLADVYWVFAAMVIGLIVAMHFIPDGANLQMSILFTALRLGCFILIISPVLWWSNRHSGLLGIVREMFPAYSGKLKGEQL